ncbi:hypothetical protein HY798_03315 [Candidatus Falkowbacteria bacterium]|nr:hypothetical protein [Candidatus Falkowbacteria bacterium]
MLYLRLLVLIVPFIVFLLFEWFFFYPKMIYVALALANLSIFFTAWQFARTSLVDKKWWNFFLLPAIFITSLAAYSLISSSKFLVQILFAVNVIFLYFYCRSIYYFLLQPTLFKEAAFENIYSYGNFLAFFFLSAVAYGLQSVLNLPVWPLIIIIYPLFLALTHGAMWASGAREKGGVIYTLINCLVLIELWWSISFLPLNYNVAALILSICYYMSVSLIRLYLLGGLNKKMARLYLIFGFSSIFLVLLTARWL